MRCLLVLVMLAGCGSSGGGDDAPEPSDNGRVFDPSITRVEVEIDFETGNEPFTGPILGFGDTFDPTLTNLDRVFAGTKQLAIPTTLGEMEDIGAIADEELEVGELLALAELHRAGRDRAGTKTYYVLFVGGVFADGSGPRPGVLGVSLGDTGVLALFKDVIRSTDVAALPNVVRFVEQATLIHELGHAIGLVDNGVPLASAHRDSEHGPHCTDDRCVMYFANEGASDAAAFVQQQLLTGDTVLFDGACLADVDALTGGL